MALGDGVRRNIRTVSSEESQRFTRALLALQEKALPGPEHRGVDFLPWHRELCNRFEEGLRQLDPALSLHYWDWNEDPRDLFTPTFNLAAEAGLPFTPDGAPLRSRSDTLASDEVLLKAPSFRRLSALLERRHAAARFAYFGGTVVNAHVSLYDPLSMLLHSNLDRLFAMWQAEAGKAWRLDPFRLYGDDNDALSNLLVEPWSTEFTPTLSNNPAIRPSPKTYAHPSVVAPPCYETIPTRIAVDAVANPGGVIRFRDVYAGSTFARAASFHVLGRGNLRFVVVEGPTGPYSVLTPGGAVTAPHSSALNQEVRIWFGYTGERPNSAAPEGRVVVRCEEMCQDFEFRLEATTVAAPRSLDKSPEDDMAGDGPASRSEPGGVTWTWTWRSALTQGDAMSGARR